MSSYPRSWPVALWSHRCGWEELAVACEEDAVARDVLDVSLGWTKRWTATWRFAGSEVTCPVRDLASMPRAGCEPMRRFSWRTGQRHRPGLQFLVSTGRHHGFESLEEARLLLALDFAGDVVDVIAQPLRLRFATAGGWRQHTPDFLATTRTGMWLLDVRPAGRIADDDHVCFAASAEAALACGWRYTVVSGWRPHVLTTLDTLSSQRRELTDRLGLQVALLAAAAAGPQRFGEVAAATVAPPVARAHLLHLLWHRRLGIDLAEPLTDATLASILGAVIELRYRRAGVDCEVRTQPYRRFRPPDLRGSSARRPRWACHCLAAPHDVRRTVSGAPAARSCGNRCGATRRDSTSGRRQPKPLVELARLRSRSQVEAADAIDHDVPGHGTFQLLRRPSDDTPAGLPRIEVSVGRGGSPPVSPAAEGLDLTPGCGLVVDGIEWSVEQLEPQYGRVSLVRDDGTRMQVSVRFLINHPGCRQSSRSRSEALPAANRGRQPKTLDDLLPHQRELASLRLAHLLEIETGFRSGDPLRPAPGEPKTAYDPAITTLTQRRWVKVAELRALDPDQARLLALDRVGYRTLIRWDVRRRRFGVLGCVDDRWLRERGGHPSITEEIREAIYAVRQETLHRSRVSMRTRERLIHQYVREQHGPEVAVPCYETLRLAWIEWFGPGGARQRYARSAARPTSTSGVHVLVDRPGQVVALDTTVVPVKVRETVFGEPVSVHLTLALDAYTHSLVAFRLRSAVDSGV
jgi:hypothetical protein